MKVKYSLAAFRASYALKNFNPAHVFEANTYIETMKLDALIGQAEVKHWKEWIGSTTWDTLKTDCDELLISWMPTTTAEVHGDEDTRSVESKCYRAITALPTVTNHCFSHNNSFYFLSGSGEIKDDRFHIEDIRSYSYMKTFPRSFFDLTLGKDDPYFNHAKVITDWTDNYNLINAYIFTSPHVQLVESYRSLLEAFKSKYLEFKIPNLVRSMESLIDCWGAKDFADKVIWLIGTPPADPVFGIHNNFRDRLINHYQIRNDCSHGKEFGLSLKNNIKVSNLNDLIGEYEFLAEWASREAFKKVLRGNYLHIFKERATLKVAWDDYKNTIPQG